MNVWRVGFVDSPCGFPPHKIYSWSNRFDDSEREFRSIYGADKPETCLKEVLADLRRNAAAISEFKRLFGDEAAETEPFGLVKKEFLMRRVLTRATAVFEAGEMVDIEEPAVRKELTLEYASLLAEHGISHLDISELTSRNRIVTQTLSRGLFDKGYAGISFGSRIDKQPCHAFFEFRAHLQPLGKSKPLGKRTPVLAKVCRELGLQLEA